MKYQDKLDLWLERATEDKDLIEELNAVKDDEDAVTVLNQIHVTRSQFGYNPEY